MRYIKHHLWQDPKNYSNANTRWLLSCITWTSSLCDGSSPLPCSPSQMLWLTWKNGFHMHSVSFQSVNLNSAACQMLLRKWKQEILCCSPGFHLTVTLSMLTHPAYYAYLEGGAGGWKSWRLSGQSQPGPHLKEWEMNENLKLNLTFFNLNPQKLWLIMRGVINPIGCGGGAANAPPLILLRFPEKK